ncbi:enoyl-CoA hydratase/isomerase family protein [Roseinatronobacter sp. S2]|uniref:enoyl-CoA hydratase/isomerase family protein n=1 Tax=Roseinatronobacter sp. S2 TaxID=3035471 RepID=UPI00240EF83B|nr:enoyl-CoA hydratase/isomerase family protein [Roseinatronobacter sp. S2]WFE76742.1 enoyl-CoA hydratase/isomerase family protein [Roseinatronobacter sp. S2]
MTTGAVTLAIEGHVAKVTFDRPEARNAMTRKMYADLQHICDALAPRADIRVAVFRGAGGRSFVAGSDIAIFDSFETGQDGIDYEREMEGHTQAVERLPFPTVAVIEGWAVGGGLNIAAACDIRVSTPDARFGVPIARTVGNCLSMFNYARLVDGLGVSRAKRLLLLGDFIDAAEARQAGFLSDVVQHDALDDHVVGLCERISENAPLTLRVSKEAVRRLREEKLNIEGEDLIAKAYGSQDFKRGVAAFKAKFKPEWYGN